MAKIYAGDRPCNCRVNEDCPLNMTSTVSGVQGNHHDERGEGLHWSDRANLQAALKCAPAFDEGQQILSQHATVEARLGPER